MELTGDLKKKAEEAASRDEARGPIENAGMRLTDGEMDAVSGGGGCSEGNIPEVENYRISSNRFVCPYCGHESEFPEHLIDTYRDGRHIEIIACSNLACSENYAYIS